jgi:hypothetical protein
VRQPLAVSMAHPAARQSAPCPQLGERGKDTIMRNMRRINFYAKRNRSGNLLHIETDGVLVNIHVGLTDRDGRQVTTLSIIPDDEQRGGDGQARIWHRDGDRIVRLHEGENELPQERPTADELEAKQAQLRAEQVALDEVLRTVPLAQRAPEIMQLLAQLNPSGEWGADEIGTLANWLTDNGFDVPDPDDDDDGPEYQVLNRTGAYTALVLAGIPAGPASLALDQLDSGGAVEITPEWDGKRPVTVTHHVTEGLYLLTYPAPPADDPIPDDPAANYQDGPCGDR